MANHKSAKKRIKQNEKRRISNRWQTSRLRTEVKKLRGFITAGTKDDALKQFPIVQALFAKLGQSSAMEKASASRKTGRLSTAINKL